MDENNSAKQAVADEIAALKKLQPKEIKKLQLDLLERVFMRLDGLEGECLQCKSSKETLREEVSRLKKSLDATGSYHSKSYQSALRITLVHLQRKHKLISDGYYVNLYMAVGIALGMPFGIAFGNNISIGLPIGMAIGLAIGSSLEADAKRKGLLI